MGLKVFTMRDPHAASALLSGALDPIQYAQDANEHDVAVSGDPRRLVLPDADRSATRSLSPPRSTVPFLQRIRSIDDPDGRASGPGMASDVYALRPFWYFGMHEKD